jgi:hypothetical protein
MSRFIKVYPGDIKEGVRYSAPVFFDDGVNMFLAAGKAAKAYHIKALKRWNIPFLITYGHIVESYDDFQDVEELEDLEPLEEVDEVLPVDDDRKTGTDT